MPTKKNIRRLIRQADLVEVDGYQYTVSSYNLNSDGPALWLSGSKSGKLAFSMSELLHARVMDDYTLEASGHHLVFIKHERLKVNVEKASMPR